MDGEVFEMIPARKTTKSFRHPALVQTVVMPVRSVAAPTPTVPIVPVGTILISRWLSESDTTGSRPSRKRFRTLKGCYRLASTNKSRSQCDSSGINEHSALSTGGVASLNHRLINIVPAGTFAEKYGAPSRSAPTLLFYHLLRLLLLSQILLLGIAESSRAADDPRKQGLVRPTEEKKKKVIQKDADGEMVLPKYSEMELPSAEDILKSKPFDWVVLKSLDVFVVEPVGARPNTLVKMNSDYERYLKGRAGFSEGEEKLQERRKQFLRIPLSLIDPGPDKETDYMLETKMIQKIDYFEDLVLNRTNTVIDEGRIPIAYDLLLLVDRRHRENNLRLKDAFEALKREESEASIEDERVRYSVPEQPPLKLLKSWPKFDETYQRLLFADAEIRSQQGDHESALRLLEELWDRNQAYPGLSERLGQIIDRTVKELVDREDFRQARFFLGRLSARDAQHSVFTRWKANLISQTANLIGAARNASAQGDAALAVSIIERAARVWPDTPGLKEAHRELNDRHQSVRLGVLRLPGDATNYPFETSADSLSKSLTHQPIFEPIRIDERGVKYRSTILESWEPMDLGRQVQFNLRLKRADWEARPLITSADFLAELARKIDSGRVEYDERLAGVIERVSAQSPSQFSIQFRRLPIRLESLFQFSVSLDSESASLNPDLVPEAIPTAGRQRFYEHERDDKRVSFRRVRPQRSKAKTRNIDEIVTIRYESWDRALQGLLRGEITGIPRVDFRDLKGLQDDNRFFVVPYTLPASHMILFNPHSVPLRDAQLRRALLLGLPRDKFVREMVPENAAPNLVRLTATPFPSVGYGHNRLIEQPPYDPQRAAALAMTAKKQQKGSLPTFRFVCPPDSQIRAMAREMIEEWRRVGITVQLIESTNETENEDWDLAYRTIKIVEPITELWPLLSLRPEAKVEKSQTASGTRSKAVAGTRTIQRLDIGNQTITQNRDGTFDRNAVHSPLGSRRVLRDSTKSCRHALTTDEFLPGRRTLDASIVVSAGRRVMKSTVATVDRVATIDKQKVLTQCLLIASILLCALVLATPTLFADERRDAPESPLPERRPYDVRMLISFDTAAFNDAAKRDVLKDLELTAKRCIGPLWSIKTSEITWISPVNERGLKRLHQSDLAKHNGDESADIWFVAVIEANSAGLRTSIRSWQPEVRLETEVVSFDVIDPRELAVTILRLCRELIRPMGIVEQVDNQSVRIRLRAGELNSPDPSFAQLGSGDVMMPLLAFRNKDKVIEKLQTIPWTYISVDSVDGSSVTGTVRSGLKLALGGKKRGRVDTLAVVVRPQFDSTRLELLSQTKPPLPLVAHRIEVRTEPNIPRVTEEHPNVDPDSTLLCELLTDRRGLTRIENQPGSSLVWLFAFSGQHMLARIPFVPGTVSQVKLEVPDDATRLSTEADLQMLQGEVIDAVALRNTAIATIRAAAKKDDWKTVNQKLALLKQQQNTNTLSDRLIAIRVAGVAAAKSRKDKTAEARISRMCDEAAALAAAHLGDDKLRLLSEEMEALQAADAASKEQK